MATADLIPMTVRREDAAVVLAEEEEALEDLAADSEVEGSVAREADFAADASM